MHDPNPNDEPIVQRAPDSEVQPSSSLPPRLRERLEARDHRANRRGGGGVVATLMILLLLVAAGGFVWWRSYNSPGNVSGSGARTASAPSDVTNATFGIAVGGNYPTQEAALTERDRLSSHTTLPVSIGQIPVDGTTQFQVILGTYYSRVQAESVGNALQQSSIVKDWKVVPLSQSL